MRIEDIRNAAEQGDAHAQYRLAVMYYKGIEVAQDAQQAAEWCRRAAAQGHGEAKFLLDGMKTASRAPKAPPPGIDEPDFDDLEPVTKTPSLFTINGIGFRFMGHSDYDPGTDSYMTTHYLTFLYIPLLPLRRYRVMSDGNLYRFLGQAALRTLDKVHIAAFCALMLYVVVAGRH